MVRRANTRYRRLDEGADDEQDIGDIELLPRHENPFDGRQALDSSRKATWSTTTLERYDTTTSATASFRDDEFLLPARLPSREVKHSGKQRFLAGWRVGALASFIGVVLVCILNLTVTIWVWKHPGHQIDGTLGTLYQGDCAWTRRMNVWIHLIVNTLSTLLLCASNYCMQVLSAPNREELVRAHAERTWLHIGVPSLRNLRHIGKDRARLWIVLCISSMPLHLLFNSVVFANLQANDYIVIPTTEAWLNGGKYDTSKFIDINATLVSNITRYMDSYRINLNDSVYIRGNEITKYQNESTADCFHMYNGQYLSKAGNVYLIQEAPAVWRNLSIWGPGVNKSSGQFTWETVHWSPQNETAKQILDSVGLINNTFPFLSSPEFYPSNGWRCPSRRLKTCDVEDRWEVPEDRSKWEPYESPVRYCMIEQVDELCRLQFSFPIAIAVIVSNFIKAICIASTLFWYKEHNALVTIGDAVASFLENPDPETRNRCLYSRRLINAQWEWERTNNAKKDEIGVDPEPFEPKRERWARAPSGNRWLATYVLFTAAILFAIICMTRSLAGMPRSLIKLWKMGFGNLQGNNLLNIDASLIGGVLLANTPQAALSYLYLAFNALYTNMFVGKEWTSYMNQRKPLRVTSPIGKQRDTYWLNVPFRFAIPMTIVSGLFHWLTSQSIFMVQISVTNAHTRHIDSQISTCGFSPIAIILATVVGTSIALGGLLIGRLRYPSGMPLASSCSAAISAACHPAPDDENAALLPVQWGAVTHTRKGSVVGEPIGHCAFSSLPVESPIPGRLYI